MKMKPHRVGARYIKDSMPPARRFLRFAASGENALQASLRESANCHNRPDTESGTSQWRVGGSRQKFTPAACEAEAGPGFTQRS